MLQVFTPAGGLIRRFSAAAMVAVGAALAAVFAAFFGWLNKRTAASADAAR
ncbi:hypothetical protein [Streptomyces cinnamoneus]|uniref:Uncharacterized protein n=1 Tax=Streptomyces cinnamoneus TaxID=53446 RepID=A0A918TZ68_STRCJ|nr:hypothetical protein [Streptomyces cinnamoneus]GHC69943.1 hypothetical protein GCM10010507_55840 [Streptomyces cinnamoneus]